MSNGETTGSRSAKLNKPKHEDYPAVSSSFHGLSRLLDIYVDNAAHEQHCLAPDQHTISYQFTSHLTAAF